MKAELSSSKTLTSIFYISEYALGSLGITREQFAYLLSLIEHRYRMSNNVIEYRIPLSNIEFRISQSFRVDGDIFENAPNVDADLFQTDKKDAFSKRSGYAWT